MELFNKVSIIGAGIAGLWVALCARQKGYAVTIYEQDSAELTGGCSYRAGGMLAFNCEADCLDDPVTSYGQKSLALWQKFLPEMITQNGSLLLTTPQDQDQLRYFQKVTKDFEIVGHDKISDLEPDLEGRFSHGLYFTNEAHLEPRCCQKSLVKLCQEMGVIIYFNTPKYDLDPDEINIDTTGLWVKKNTTFDFKSLRGVKGEMVVIKCPDINFTRPVRLLHPHHPIYIVPYQDNHYMIGATTIESASEIKSNNLSLRSAGILLTQAFNVHPAFGEAEIIDMNVGYRPAFNDNKPAIFKQDNVYYLNGLYRHGWTVAPALADELVQKLP